VAGASPNPSRYSHVAVLRLHAAGHPVIAVGIRTGFIGDTPIATDWPLVSGVDTVTLYVGPSNQPAWKDYILSLRPRRVIFNPGAENPEFERLLQDAGIHTEEACTLVLLSTGTY